MFQMPFFTTWTHTSTDWAFEGSLSQTEMLYRVRYKRLHTGRENIRVLKAQVGSYVVRR
jgi:hypothetical protein